MLFQPMFPRDLFSEMMQLHQQMDRLLNGESETHGLNARSFPAVNVGSTPYSLEIYAFLPGLDPDKIEVTVESGTLTLSGKRDDALATKEANANVQMNERFAGSFRRSLSLPEDLDLNAVDARYRDGVLHLSIKRRHEAQPKRISIH